MFVNLTRKNGGPGLLFLFALVFIPPCARPLPGEELPPDQEFALSAESPLEEELFDDGSFFFEAPPLVFEVPPVLESRSFDDIFPNFSRTRKRDVMSDTGLRYSFEKDGFPTLIPGPDSGIDLLSGVMEKKPSHVIEALVVVPYNKRELDMIDIYNALGRVKNIKDYTLLIGDREFTIFTETTRLASARDRKPLPDPEPANTLPASETMYLLFLDPYMGDLYLRGDISVSLYGITYSMTNFRDISYSIFRVMKAERFSAIIYVEPIKEGVLIYSVSGLYLPNFIAKRINLTPNMNRRITVLLDWITDGLRIQEDNRPDYILYRPQQ